MIGDNETTMIAGDNGEGGEFEFDNNENSFDDNDVDQGNNQIEYEIPHVMKLKEIKQVGRETKLSELTFSKLPDAGMMMHLPLGVGGSSYKLGHFIPIVAGMCCVPVSYVKKLGFSDLQDAIGVVNYFLINSGQTGEPK